MFFKFSLYSQTAEEVLVNVSKVFDKNNFLSFKSNYNFFKSHSSKTPMETYPGIYKKKGNNLYQKIGQTEFVIIGDKSLKIVNSEKTMMTFHTSQSMNQNQFDFKLMKTMFTVKSLKDKKSYWEIELEAKQFSTVSYGLIRLIVDKNYRVKKQIFYYNTAINFSKSISKSDIDYPRLEIDISDYSTNPIDLSYFDISKYVLISKQGINPIGKYSNYKLITQK